MWERISDDTMWVAEHHAELKERFPDMEVVVYKRKVIGVAEDYEGVKPFLRRLEKKGIPRNHITVLRVYTTRRLVLIGSAQAA